MFWYWSHIRRYATRFNHITTLILHSLLHHFTPLHMQIKKCSLRSHRHEFSITFSIWVLESLAAWARCHDKTFIKYSISVWQMYTYLNVLASIRENGHLTHGYPCSSQGWKTSWSWSEWFKINFQLSYTYDFYYSTT